MRANVNSSLRRRPSRMTDYDRLPPELRHWLAHAALPWSVTSVRKLWTKAQSASKDPNAALAYLSQIEARALDRDAPQIWGASRPTLSCSKYSRG